MQEKLQQDEEAKLATEVAMVSQMQELVSADQEVIKTVTEAKRRFSIASDRIFLAGTGTGGTMALRLAMVAPQHFAGVATIGGAMPDNDQPLAGIERARCGPLGSSARAGH